MVPPKRQKKRCGRRLQIGNKNTDNDTNRVCPQTITSQGVPVLESSTCLHSATRMSGADPDALIMQKSGYLEERDQ